MRLSLLLFLMSIEIVLVVSRRCHTCETKTIDRFSGEESVTDKCSSYPSTLKYMNCTDPREYCSFYVFNHINYKDYTRGCAIPRGRYTKKCYYKWIRHPPDPCGYSAEDDALKTGIKSICWYSLNSRSQYDGNTVCFCKGDFCNKSKNKMAWYQPTSYSFNPRLSVSFFPVIMLIFSNIYN